MDEVEYPKLGDLRVEEVSRPAIPVKEEVSRAFKEEEMENWLENLDNEEGRIVLKLMEDGISDKGRLNLAHQLFIYGLPEGPRRGIPIRSVIKLGRLCGVHQKLLAPHVRPWTREAMRLARDASPIYAFAVSKAARETHLEDLERMRSQIVEIEEAIAHSLPGSRQWIDLRRLLAEARKEWRDASGVTSGVKISEEAAKLQAKLLLQSIDEEHNDIPHALPKHTKGRVFDLD